MSDTYTRCLKCCAGWFGSSDECPDCGGQLKPDPVPEGTGITSAWHTFARDAYRAGYAAGWAGKASDIDE